MRGVRPNLFWLSDVGNVLMALVLVVDVEIHHLETPHQLEFTNISVIAQGALRAAVRALVTYGKSTIEVTVSVLYVLRARYCLISFTGRYRWTLLLVCA
jgi:hypothetical protein